VGATWLDGYSGQTTEELLALEGEYRVDSIILAFEQALGAKSAMEALTREEQVILAVEALEREVNNGGYGQFFAYSPESLDTIGEALDAIGCPRTAALTRRAMESRDDDAALEACDADYFSSGEPIADRLFGWIRANHGSVRLGTAGQTAASEEEQRPAWWKRLGRKSQG